MPSASLPFPTTKKGPLHKSPFSAIISACLSHYSKKLGDLLHDLIVVGGLVPSLLHPRKWVAINRIKFCYFITSVTVYWVTERVAELMSMEIEQVTAFGKAPQTVKARSLLCFWAHRKLGMTTIEIGKRLNISQSAVSRSSLRGQKIERENRFELIELNA